MSLTNGLQRWKLLPMLGISDVSANRLNRTVLSIDGSVAQGCNGWHLLALGSHVRSWFSHGHGHQRSWCLGDVALRLLQTGLDIAQLGKEIEIEAVSVRSRRLIGFRIREDISNGIISCRFWRRFWRRGHGSCILFSLNKCSRVGEDGQSGEATWGRLCHLLCNSNLFIGGR
jgi:hypothetical protein